MRTSHSALHQRWLVPVLVYSLFVAGCATTSRQAPPIQLADEQAAFTVDASALSILDAATIVLVNNNFSINVANERIGLIQTDYLPLSSLNASRQDPVSARQLGRLTMRVTVTVEERPAGALVSARGAFRSSGTATAEDPLIMRYWLEQLAARIAQRLDAQYEPVITDAAYAEAVEAAEATPQSTSAIPGGNVVRAVAIVAVGLFVVTLLTGVFGPGAP